MTTFTRVRITKRARALITAGLAAAVVAGAAPAQAVTPLTPLTSESFTNAATSSSAWSVPSRSTNSACLTAGSDTAQRPIAGCALSTPDAAGSGTLRLSSNINNAVGTTYNTASLPTTKGLDVRFNTYQYNSTSNPGADGIAFILAATDPTNPAPPATRGPLGGSLGYSASGSTAGVSYGYLGFGLDVFGNYRNSNFGGSGCQSSTASAQNITVRGPGNGTAGYCIANTAQVSSGALDARTSTSRPAPVPVEIAVNPSGATATAQGGFDVPAQSWAIQVTPLGGSPQTLTGPLPSKTALSGLGFPAAYVDPDTGLPYQLTFGWAASTGGNNEIHEINTLTTQTLTGQLPVYRLDVRDNENGTLLAGNKADVVVTPSLGSAQGDESKAPTVTTTFPAGLTPASSVSSSGYACSTSGQVVTCTYTGATPVVAGGSFPAIHIPVSVAPAATGNYSISAKVSSVDGNPAVASRTVVVTQLSASATPAAVTHGAVSTLGVSGLPSSATGTIHFASNGADLCVATLPATSCDTSSSLAAGTYSVTASYSGDSAFAPQSANTALTVTKATATVTATATPASTTYGTTSTLSFAGLPSDATGTISFDDGGTHLCTATLPTTSCSTSDTLGVGSYTVDAHYSGDDNYTSRDAGTTLTVGKATPPLTAAPATDSVAYGTAQTLGATGLPGDADGTVTYTSGGSTLCTQTVPADTSCLTSAALPAGTYTVVASYSGNANYDSVQDTFPFEVTKADVHLSAGATSPSVTYGDSDTLTASGLTVTGATAATGTVTFTDGSRTLCTATLPATSCATSASLGAGTYSVTATYSGDANHDTASATTSFQVVKRGAGNAFTAASTPASVTYGTSSVLSFAGLPSGASGSVAFVHAGSTLCTATLPATSCSTDRWTPTGGYDVTAKYSGDGNHETASATTHLDVTRVSTPLVASVAGPDIVFGTSQTLLATGFDGHATGTVTFVSGGKTLCVATLPATSCTADGPAAGTYPTTAIYSGDDNHVTASATTTFSVHPRTTALTATATPAAVSYPNAARLVVGGLPSGATGTVTMRSGTRLLCTVTLPATGCATPRGLSATDYPVTATYSGDANDEASTAHTSFTVTKAAVDLAIPMPTVPAEAGAPAKLQATGVPATGTGTVTFTAGHTVLCVTTLPATSCLTSSLVPGRYKVTATYSGDADHLPSTTTRTYTVATVVSDTATSGQPRSVTLPGGNGEKVTITGPPAHGDARIVGGKLVYTPPAGFTGTAKVTVTIVDADGEPHVVTYRFQVDAASATPSSGTTNAHSTSSGKATEVGTADTGTPVARLLVAAVTLLGAGVVVTVGARRRRIG